MEDGVNVYSIKDLEDIAGIKAHTIRIWEKRYKLLSPDRTDTNIRTYNDTELKKILNVAFLNRNGYKISRIVSLDDEGLAQKVIEISERKYVDLRDFQPDKILSSAANFDENTLKSEISFLVERYGFEAAYSKYLYFLSERAKLMWQTGHFSRSQAQFVNNVIKNTVITEDAFLKPKSVKKAPSVAMICVTNNLNENNFLFYKYVLRKRGFDVIFPGGLLPLSEVFEIYMTKPFEYLVLNNNVFDFAEKKLSYFQNIGQSLVLKKIIFTDFSNSKMGKREGILQFCYTPDDFVQVANLI